MPTVRHSRIPRPPPGAPARAASRGSVLIVALLISALIAVSLASYLSLNLSSTRLAKSTACHSSCSPNSMLPGFTSAKYTPSLENAHMIAWTFCQRSPNCSAFSSIHSAITSGR